MNTSVFSHETKNNSVTGFVTRQIKPHYSQCRAYFHACHRIDDEQPVLNIGRQGDN